MEGPRPPHPSHARGEPLDGAAGRASERLAWAAEVVAPQETDRVLEVGCGHGVLVSLLAGRVPRGEVVAVDRSPTMTAAAGRRNADAVAAGRVRLITAALTAAELGAAPFDAVVSFDVRAFWTPPAPEWGVVDRVLAPGGRVVVAFSLMDPDDRERLTAGLAGLAGPHGFTVVATTSTTPTTYSAPFATAAVELRRAADG